MHALSLIFIVLGHNPSGLSNNSIDNGEIQTIVDYLDGITGQVSNENINHIVDKLNNIYINAAKMSLGTTKVYKNGTPKTQNKPWFSYECKQARKQYRRSKNYFYRKRTEYARTKLKEKEKSYKKTLDKEIAIYRKQMGKKLKDMKSKNPKEYWNILNLISISEIVDNDLFYNFIVFGGV